MRALLLRYHPPHPVAVLACCDVYGSLEDACEDALVRGFAAAEVGGVEISNDGNLRRRSYRGPRTLTGTIYNVWENISRQVRYPLRFARHAREFPERNATERHDHARPAFGDGLLQVRAAL